MAYKVISLIVLTICHAQHALADVKDVPQLGKAMSNAFVPAGQIPQASGSVFANPSTAVAPKNAETPFGHQFESTLQMGETLQGQNLRGRMQKLPQADAEDAQDGFGFGSLMGLMASVGLVGSMGVAAYRKYGSQRSRPIVAKTAQDGGFTTEDLKEQAKQLNPVVGYYDPMCLGEPENAFWNFDNEATIGFLRHAEIKHGRAAMAGFVGYIVHENHIHFPWAPVGGVSDYSSFEGLSAPAIWDAMPLEAKQQIILFIGFLEVYSERSDILEAEGQKHYMRGGKPGYFPSLQGVPHPVPFKFFDPFNLQKGKSDEWKQKKLLVEINNGRLAMIALISFICEAKIPGSIPLLGGKILPYAGDVMAPFQVGAWSPYK